MTNRFILPLIAAGTVIAGGMASWAASQARPKSHDNAVTQNLAIFNAVVREVEQNYVDSTRPDEAFETAIAGYLSTIDPYTEYYTADDQEVLRQMTTGEYAGIGSYILQRDGVTYITFPMEGSPAAIGGLRPGDKIVRVDTTDVLNPKGQDVSKLLRGQPGTTVRVSVDRPWVEDSLLTFDIVRESVRRPSVEYYGVINGNTGYIALNSFIESTPQEVAEALKSFQADPAVKQLVLDLRGNGGGLVNSAIDILGNFLPKGTQVISTRTKGSKLDKVYRTSTVPMMPDIPMVVLIDGGSASAAEITAGALQDLDRAVLVGSRSFGKGLVQATRNLPYGGVLKVTVDKYYLPSGRLLQALDYSRRNEDGSVARTPDSLTNEYKTRGGRIVRDGGGLTPDSTVTWSHPTQLLYTLVRDNRIFDYAVEYAAKNPAPATPEEIVVTDAMYDDFVKRTTTDSLKYNRPWQDVMPRLRNILKDEGYLDDRISSQIDSLEKSLQVDLAEDMRLKRDEISGYLAEDLAQIWFYDRGKSIVRLRRDTGLDKAIEILDSGLYRKILGRD
ncbi:MAG: S41 family peptidase [Bacteroides sp.]|nr:S41 family peptidase [Bacteroides sp.]